MSVGTALLVALAAAMAGAVGAAGAAGCANGTSDTPFDPGAPVTTVRDSGAGASLDDGGGDDDDAGGNVGGDSNEDSGAPSTLADGGEPDASAATDSGGGTLDGGAPADAGGGPAPDSGSGACSSTPTIPSEQDGNSCFGAGTDGCLGNDVVCCDQPTGGKDTGTCVSSSSSCTAPSGGTAYAYSCGTPADCSSGAYCVLSAATSNSAVTVDSCGNVSGVKGSICATNPATSDFFVCASNTDCEISVGGTCTPFSVNNKFFGICQ